MFNWLNRYKIGQQLLVLTLIITIAILGSLILLVNKLSQDAAIRQAEEGLQRDLVMLSSFLDYTYKTQVITAQRRMAGFVKLLPGKLSVTTALVKTGDTEDVPVVKAGHEVMNNNLQYLEMLKQVNTAEGFILAKKGNDFVRVATLLKDGQGKSQVGQALKADEPQIAALQRGDGYIGIINRNGKSYMSIYEPIRDDAGKVVGAYGLRSNIEADLASLREIVKKEKVGETGYFFAFSEAGADIGRMTIHPSKEGSTIRELFSGQQEVLSSLERIVKEKGGITSYLWPNPAKEGRPEQKLTVFRFSPEWGWYIGAGTFLDELTVDATRLRNILVAATAVAALVIGLTIYLAIANRLRPLAGIVSGLSAIGNGRLNEEHPATPANSANELHILSQQLDSTAKSIRGLVNSIADTAKQLGSSAQQLDNSSKEVAIAAQEQSDAAANMAASVEEFSVSVTQVADLAREASEVAQHESQAANQGGQMVSEVKGEMESLAESVKASGNLVESLDKRSLEIEGIVRLIQEVAEQTNLLALNAAIEAARAGEAGRGFAVVADEVRKLAERTAGATGDISRMINGVRSETQQVVEKMRTVVSDVNEGVKKVEQAGTALQDIRNEAQHSASVISDIASATQEQSIAGNEVAQRLESVAQMAEETSAITAQNREAVAQLARLSERLQTDVSRFTL